ncbi:hypothetical protein L228DRAFT_162856 [Xylona heveae TC161]|uniref:Uncharacterized protein n=1 Tax=Xylona heveae (strain CBS 132557 / TC161) TaxID=1328760 RepID=A0A165G9N3_XYLHT|nr:hypothetical protein L228DRAFT_162856 [Xylona heveae TC161]KZF21911.1 hypothetical protein L228DRAFT_162856 [Xylona heveae TC161]
MRSQHQYICVGPQSLCIIGPLQSFSDSRQYIFGLFFISTHGHAFKTPNECTICGTGAYWSWQGGSTVGYLFLITFFINLRHSISALYFDSRICWRVISFIYFIHLKAFLLGCDKRSGSFHHFHPLGLNGFLGLAWHVCLFQVRFPLAMYGLCSASSLCSLRSGLAWKEDKRAAVFCLASYFFRFVFPFRFLSFLSSFLGIFLLNFF